MTPRAVLLTILVLGSCKGTKTRAQLDEAWDQTKKNVPVAVVLVFTYPFGLGIQAASTIATVIITDLWDSKAELSSGETMTKEQLAEELDRWKGHATEMATVATAASKARDWLNTLIEYILFGAITSFMVWLHWRNRHNWRKLGYWKGVWSHGVFGGTVGTKAALDKSRVVSRLSEEST